MAETHTKQADDFYKSLGENYDLMTSDSTRWNDVKLQYDKLFDVFHPRHILDAGCGTGGESILLNDMGFNVTGVDISSEFIRLAMSKLGPNRRGIKFEIDDLRQLKSVEDGSVDFVNCRGNTLPHLTDETDLRLTLKSFKRTVKKDGLLILQWLNYPLIQKQAQRLVGVTGAGDHVFVRFYDFIGDNIVRFNILHMDSDNKWNTEWISTELRTWNGDDVGMLLVETGWKNIEIASNIDRSDFDPDRSKNIVMFATG